MRLSALIQLIRDVQRVAPANRLIIFGSSSLFASFPEIPPEKIGVALTLDADFFLDPNNEEIRLRLLDQFGQDQEYQGMTGFYGDFVDIRLADAFPKGWRDRLVPMQGFEDVFGIDPVDMAVMKIFATSRSRLSRRLGGEMPDRGFKDINTIVALLKFGLIMRGDVEKRLSDLDIAPALTVECGKTLDEILALVDAR